MMPHFKFVFWDLAIKEDSSPVIIEANLQYPDITILQRVCGPFFGDYAEELLG